MTIDEVAAAVLRATQTAATAYHRISGEPPWDAPESFMSAHIALALGNHLWVSLEETEATLRRFGRGSPRGRYHRDSKRGRIDVAVWNADESVKAAIEVKKFMTVGRLDGDVARLRGLYRKRTAKHGLVATFGHFQSEALAFSRLETIEDELGLRCLKSRVRRNGPWKNSEVGGIIIFAVLRVLRD